ncbi:MAG: hypothetical protein M1480_00525 [Bacteroidetes bacterium]|nr:hypothetical protein [Bacteroidota bacterium]
MAKKKKKKKEPVYKSEKSRKRALRKKNPFYHRFSSISKRKNSKIYDLEKNPEILYLIAPQNFSLSKLSYIEATLKFFNKLDSGVHRYNSVFLNMENITFLSEDAILYLLSRLHAYKIMYPNYSVSGNFPNDKTCEKLLLDSNFTKYIITKRKPKINNKEIFPIRDGIDSDGEILGEVLNFIESKIDLSEDNSFDMYGPMLECLTNSKNHAYNNSMSKLHRWWLIAIPDKNHKKVHYTSLDNGLGIPTTINKKFADIVKSFVSNKDPDLIISALNGEFRTRTGKVERGKGLPSVFESTNNKQIDNLTIISNFAYVKIGRNKKILEKELLVKRFRGTLISWDFVE